jgi:N-acetylglucosaminyl-diphospho-decaprenol L-rhamnosyltransferase
LQSSCVQSLPTVMNQLLDCDFLRGLFPHSSLWGTSALWAPGSAPAEVEAVSGACLLARQKDFLGVGGFSENYFMYGEDLDLCFKIRRAGAKIFYIPGTSLVHFGGGSSSRAPSNSSVILMRESVQRFIGSNQGPWAARGYRLAMALAALFRLVVLSPLLLGRKADRSAAGAWAKWWAILRWSMGLSSSVKS